METEANMNFRIPLVNWFPTPRPLPHEPSFALCVAGQVATDPGDIITSTPIYQRFSSTHVVTVKGQSYELLGPMDINTAKERGVSDTLCAGFIGGFSIAWDTIFARELKSLRSSRSTSRADPALSTSGLTTPAGTSRLEEVQLQEDPEDDFNHLPRFHPESAQKNGSGTLVERVKGRGSSRRNGKQTAIPIGVEPEMDEGADDYLPSSLFAMSRQVQGRNVSASQIVERLARNVASIPDESNAFVNSRPLPDLSKSEETPEPPPDLAETVLGTSSKRSRRLMPDSEEHELDQLPTRKKRVQDARIRVEDEGREDGSHEIGFTEVIAASISSPGPQRSDVAASSVRNGKTPRRLIERKGDEVKPEESTGRRKSLPRRKKGEEGKEIRVEKDQRQAKSPAKRGGGHVEVEEEDSGAATKRSPSKSLSPRRQKGPQKSTPMPASPRRGRPGSVEESTPSSSRSKRARRPPSDFWVIDPERMGSPKKS